MASPELEAPSARQLVNLYARRMQIESSFRDLKSHRYGQGFQDSLTRVGKRIEIALTYIYGIGRSRAAEILAATGVSPDLRVKDLTDAELVPLRDYIEGNLKVEGDLRREVAADIRRKVEIGCYQGIRHRRGLPVRGQRTHTNARTRKGPRKTVAGKKKAGKK